MILFSWPLSRLKLRSPRLAAPLLAALALLLAPTAPATADAPQATPTTALPPSALPPLPDQSDPWLYRGSDVPHDKQWIFGTLPNGLRWAVRQNSVPPGQVAIRIRMDVGSLNEQAGEEGFAHLIEHLVFRRSRYLGSEEAISAWQRLGATFGSDTNAETTPLHTVFKIDLPEASPAGLDESFKLLSGMMIAPTLAESDIRTEVPIVLAEKRERGGIAERLDDASRAVIFAGQPMADHATIGSVASVSGAHEDAVRAFHRRWYRPENAAIIVAGDADPRLLAALVAKWFGDWPVVGPHTPEPDLGTPAPVAGADPANPVGPARVLVQPEVPRSLSYVMARPWHEKHDTIVYNDGLMTDQVALAIINRQLELRARAGAPFLAAEVSQENSERSIEGTFVHITPDGADWRAALRGVRGDIARVLAAPPSPAAIAREVAEMNVVYESQEQQSLLQPGGRIADDLVQALDIHETVASPQTVHALFQNAIPLFTPEAVLAHARALFRGVAIRAIYITPDASDGGDSSNSDSAALAQALREPVRGTEAPPPDAAPIAFADLPPIGPVTPTPVAKPTGLLGIEQLDFANGVKALLWATPDEPGRVLVKVRFGAGRRAFAPEEQAAAALGAHALISAGEGPLGQNELDRITTGRKMGFDFQIHDGFFAFSAETRAEDLADQLTLFAEKFAASRWDAAPIHRAAGFEALGYLSLAASPDGVLSRDLAFLEHDRDPRYATPTPAALAAVTPERFRAVWAPILARGPIEIEVFGDFDRAKGIAALCRSFGALAPREALPVTVASDTPAFAAPTPQPVVLYHHGDANQAAAVVSWPTGGGMADLKLSRQLEVLSQIFQNRLLLALREKAGASYAPQVASQWPLDLKTGGDIRAIAQLQPGMVPSFFATVDAIAADLAARPPSDDELALVIEPMRQQINRAATSAAFFMWQIEGATQDPARLAGVRSLLKDYADVTPAMVQALAQRYLAPAHIWRLAVLPQPAPEPPAGTATRAAR